MSIASDIAQPIWASIATPAAGTEDGGGVPAKKYFLNTTGGKLWFSRFEYRAYGDNGEFKSRLIGGAPLNFFLNKWEGGASPAIFTYLSTPILSALDYADAQQIVSGPPVVTDDRFDWKWAIERNSFSAIYNTASYESGNDEVTNPIDMRDEAAYFNEITGTANARLDSVKLNSVTGIQNGNFVQFNNVDIYAKFPLIELTGDFRVHLWVRRDKGGGVNKRVALWSGLTGTDDAAWIYDTDAPSGGDNRWLLKSGSSTIMFVTGAFDAIRDTQDCEIELVRTGTTIQLYLDGVLASSLTSALPVRITDIGYTPGEYSPSMMSNITVEDITNDKRYVLDMSGQDVVNTVDARMRNLDPSALPDEVVIEDEAPTSFDASWTDNGNGSFTIDGSQVAVQDIVFSPPGMAAGMCYRVSFTVSSRTAGNISLRCGGEDGGLQVASNGAKELFVRCGTTPATGLRLRANVDFAATVSDIVIRQTYDGQWFNVDPATDIVSIPRQSRFFSFLNKTTKPYVRDLYAPADVDVVQEYAATNDPSDYSIATGDWKVENGVTNQQDGSFRADGVTGSGRVFFRTATGVDTSDKAFEGWIEVKANRPEDVGKTLKPNLQRNGPTNFNPNIGATVYEAPEITLTADWQRVYCGVHHNYEIAGQTGFRVTLTVPVANTAEAAWFDVRNPELYDISRHALMNGLDPLTDFEEA